jgi:hypothetical protein
VLIFVIAALTLRVWTAHHLYEWISGRFRHPAAVLGRRIG